MAESAGIESWRPELLRQRTAWRLAVQMIDFAGAKAEWLAALAMARRQSAGTFTLRIATDLARASKRTDDAEWAAHQLAESIAELDATRMSGPDLAFPDRRVALETLADLRHD